MSKPRPILVTFKLSETKKVGIDGGKSLFWELNDVQMILIDSWHQCLSMGHNR